jgi:hypothetical protein
VRLGSDCPADGIPADLPADSAVVYVRAGAAPGGDGTRTRPFPSLTEAGVDTLPAGTVVAVGSGVYDEPIVLSAGVELRGACIDDTTLMASTPDLSSGVVTITGTATRVRNLSIGPSPRPGLWLEAGAAVELEGVWLEGLEAAGISARGASVTASEIAIVSTQARSDETATTDGESGNAVTLRSGSTLVMSRALLDDNREYTIYARDDGTSVALSDLVIRGTREKPIPFEGYLSNGEGLTLDLGATGTVARAAVEDNFGTSLRAYDASLLIEDTVILGGQTGLRSSSAARVEATRVRIDGPERSGAEAVGGELSLDNIVIRDVNPEGVPRLGAGLSATRGGTLDAIRIVVTRAAAIGIGVNHVVDPDADAGPVVVGLVDVLVDGTTGQLQDASIGGFGFSIGLGVAAELTASRLVARRGRQVGLFAENQAQAWLEDSLITQTLDGVCNPDPCAEPLPGFGVGVYRSATVELRRFAVVDSDTCGVHIDDDGVLRLAEGEVSGTAIGACVQVDGYDLGQLQNDVVYRDNDINLDATDLPVPEIGRLDS